ncbi:hypothetical protein MMYC01_209964 [Madurella mycetomatis]|uniref:Uncharacterized protein n=1 Tax=Madurella mycetomatis TaxID=100816 RepID=A0A175VQS0_9PEZI|nr:hypothetical protein MMYC01_209964 [Madurella mycetomatis]
MSSADGVLSVPDRALAARKLIALLTPLATDSESTVSASSTSTAPLNTDVLAATKELLQSLISDKPVYATFHDGQVHDPLGGGAYAFRDDLIEPVVLGLVNDELLCSGTGAVDGLIKVGGTEHNGVEGVEMPVPANLPTRPIIIHAGAQPNNSPHCGTLVVFCYAFAVAQAIRDRLQAKAAGTKFKPPSVSVEVTFVDTAPVNGEGLEIDGIQYQKSYRDVPEALQTRMGDYRDVLALLSTWSSIPFTTAFQSDFFAHPSMPLILEYITSRHSSLGRQLSPKYGTLALRAACPVSGCSLAEKHGRLNTYHFGDDNNNNTTSNNNNTSHETNGSKITFHCPRHGPHHIHLTRPAEVARLEANAPARNLIRSMSHLLDARAHHVRVTGADYAGMYQEVFLHRPLAAWSAATGLAPGRTPHILYAPLVVDWSGAKLSKSLYVREGGYEMMRVLGTDGLCSYAQLKEQFGVVGLRRVWEEVGRWMRDPRRLFRAWSVEYLAGVVRREECGRSGTDTSFRSGHL